MDICRRTLGGVEGRTLRERNLSESAGQSALAGVEVRWGETVLPPQLV